MFDNPDCYLFGFEADTAIFLEMDRAAYHRSIFLDQRIHPVSEQPLHAPLSDIATPLQSPAAGWIFHLAHCGSTLLARALDRSHGGVVLREPFALRQLGSEAANGASSDPNWHTRLQLSLALLSRRYAPDQPSIIKANVPVNFIIRELMAYNQTAPAILLHFPLADYLTAILRSPGNRNWMRNVTTELQPAISAWVGAMPDDEDERAGALWLAQMRCYADALERFPNIYSLDAETLFATPGPVIAAVASLFGQPIGAAELAALVAGPLFATYSKNPAAAFDNAARLARNAEQAPVLAESIAKAKIWVSQRLNTHNLPPRLARPLISSIPQRDLIV